MKLHEAKDKCQKEALNAWHNVRGCIGTLQLCTGAGKTRCALKAIEWVFSLNPDAKVLIICPTEIIRDATFPGEFKKWKMGKLLDKVELSCIQTVYKYKGRHYDLIIGDELHNYLPEEDDYYSKAYEYHKFFENNMYDKLLGLTAWIPEKKRSVAKKIAPVAYTLTTDEGVKRGIISPYVEMNIPVQMGAEELGMYKQIDAAYRNIERQLGGFRAFTNASGLLKKFKGVDSKNMSETDSKNYQLAIQFYKMMHKRKNFLYNVPCKIKAIHKLIDEGGLEKSVIFAQSVLFADLLALKREDIIPYHSKVKSRDKAMKSFRDGRTKVTHLSTCMAVNEGMDLPKLPAIIIASRTSGAKAHIQRRGRCLRFEEGKISIVFNFYLKGTQDEKWLRSSQSTTDPSNIIELDGIDEAIANYTKAVVA